MKTFLVYWCAAAIATLAIPSLVVAIASVWFISFYGQTSFSFGAVVFFRTMSTVFDMFFWPALIVLLIGLFICMKKSAVLKSKSNQRPAKSARRRSSQRSKSSKRSKTW